jgi:integrase
MTFSTNITRRVRHRILTDGTEVNQTRHVLQFRDPITRKRRQLFFERREQALAKRDELVASVATHAYSTPRRSKLTVSEAIDRWLETRRGEVKPVTWEGYQHLCRYVTGPLLVGGKRERRIWTERGEKPKDAAFLDLLGPFLVAELTTADIRNWHKTVTAQVSSHTANLAKAFLRAALALCAEELRLHVPPMPLNLGRGRPKVKKAILTPEQVGKVIDAAKRDALRGVYYAFPWLTGTRPSEQLALLWEDLDFEASVSRQQLSVCLFRRARVAGLNQRHP